MRFLDWLCYLTVSIIFIGLVACSDVNDVTERSKTTLNSLSRVTSPLSGQSPILPQPFPEEPFAFHMGQNTAQALGFNAAQLERFYAITIDHDGNTIIAGYSTGGSLGDTPAGSSDIVVMKISPKGDFIWSTQFGNSWQNTTGLNASNVDSARAIVVDANNDIFIAGHTKSNLGEANAGKEDVFVAKLQADGSFVWVTQLGQGNHGPAFGSAGDQETVNNMEIDTPGNLYVVGATSSGLAAGETTASDLGDIFVAKFIPNSNGADLAWLTQLGPVTLQSLPVCAACNAAEGDTANAVAITANGKVIVVGNTSGDLIEVNPAPAGGSNDIVMLSLNASDGSIHWLKQLGSTSGVGLGSLGVDASGTDMATGVVANNNVFYAVGATSSSLGDANGGSSDLFLVKFATADGAFQAITQLGASSSFDTTGLDTIATPGNSLRQDSNGDLIIAARTKGSLAETQAGVDDMVFAKFDTDLSLLWLHQFGVETAAALQMSGLNVDFGFSDRCHSIAIDNNDYIHIGGYTFGNIGDNQAGNFDAFAIRLTPDGELL